MKKFVRFYYRYSFKVCLCAFLSLIGLTVLSSSAFALQSGDFTYTVSGGTVTITGFTSCQSELTPTAVIPDTIDDMPVVGIGDSAFFNCSGLTSVTIPDSVTSIGGSAFAYCSGLTSVTIPNSVTSIGTAAFRDCRGLTSIVVDASNTAYSSQDGVLYNKAMTTLIQYPGGKSGEFIIPDSVKHIGRYAFRDCSGLTSVTIGNSVTSIGDSAFYNCSGLTSVTIPDSVTSIESDAFFNCSGLTSVTISNSVTSIWGGTFVGCSGLTSVTIPNSVTRIGSYAFSGCSGLTKAYFNGNAPSMGLGVFDGCASNFSICYTAGSTGFTSPWWQGYPASVCVPPTLINLSSFTATPKSGKIILEWSTESEIDNAGFNIYRSETETGGYIKIHDSLIPTQGSTTQGASYEFIDNEVKNRKTYYYKLEDIDLNGTSTMHGPVSATPRWFLGIFSIFRK